jgi:hypothetical protein
VVRSAWVLEGVLALLLLRRSAVERDRRVLTLLLHARLAIACDQNTCLCPCVRCVCVCVCVCVRVCVCVCVCV